MGTKIAVEGTQICNTCWLELPVTDFYKHTDYANGRMKRCKVCHNKGTVERKKQKGSDDYEKRKAKNPPATEGTQICDVCWLDYPVTDFYASANYANGRMKTCKRCHKERTIELREEILEEELEKKHAHLRQWWEKNKHKYEE